VLKLKLKCRCITCT